MRAEGSRARGKVQDGDWGDDLVWYPLWQGAIARVEERTMKRSGEELGRLLTKQVLKRFR